jgi:hypothetical protein
MELFQGFTPPCVSMFLFHKADPSLKSFLFTVKNPHNFPERKFPLKAEKKHEAIFCDSSWGPHF